MPGSFLFVATPAKKFINLSISLRSAGSRRLFRRSAEDVSVRRIRKRRTWLSAYRIPARETPAPGLR